MISSNKLRQRIIERVKNLPDDRLNTLEGYLEDLEKGIHQKSEILSFAGIFEDLDEEFTDDLTINLHERRLKGTSRIE